MTIKLSFKSSTPPLFINCLFSENTPPHGPRLCSIPYLPYFSGNSENLEHFKALNLNIHMTIFFIFVYNNCMIIMLFQKKRLITKKIILSAFHLKIRKFKIYNNLILKIFIHWLWLGASKSTQRYRVRERKWETRETLARGVYPPYRPLHTNGEEINYRNIERLHYTFNAVLTYVAGRGVNMDSVGRGGDFF